MSSKHESNYNEKTLEGKIRIALGELGATWEDPELTIKNVLDIFHHQLQKARQDWLREEIVKLERVQYAYTNLDSKRLRYEKQTYNKTIQTIIDMHQRELDQDKKN